MTNPISVPAVNTCFLDNRFSIGLMRLLMKIPTKIVMMMDKINIIMSVILFDHL